MRILLHLGRPLAGRLPLLGIALLLAATPTTVTATTALGDGSVVRYAPSPVTRETARKVGACCHNGSHLTSLDQDFHCKDGAAAGPCLEDLVSRADAKATQQWQAWMGELTPAALDSLRTPPCPAGNAGFRCIDERLQKAASKTDTDFNPKRALSAFRKYQALVIERSLFGMACERAKGRSPETAIATPDPSCQRITPVSPFAGKAVAPKQKPLECPFQVQGNCPPASASAPKIDDALLESTYQTQKPAFERSVRQFALDRMMERLLLQTRFGERPTPAIWAKRSEELAAWVGEPSCLGEEGANRARALASRIWEQTSHADPQGATAVSEYPRQLAMAGQCLTATTRRWNELRTILGINIKRTGPIVTDEDVQKLPEGTRHVVSGILSLPGLREILTQTQFFSGAKEASQATCDLFKTLPQTDPGAPVGSGGGSRLQYCQRAFEEFERISREIQNLHANFPILALRERAPEEGPTVAEKIGLAAPLPLLVEHYRKYWNDREAPDTADPRSCLDQLTAVNAPPHPDALRAASEANWRYSSEIRATFLQGIQALCNPKEAQKLTPQLVENRSLMRGYFSCPNAAQAKAECAERTAMHWIACRYHAELGEKQKTDKFKILALQLVSDGLYFVGPEFKAFTIPSLTAAGPGTRPFRARLPADWVMQSLRMGTSPEQMPP